MVVENFKYYALISITLWVIGIILFVLSYRSKNHLFPKLALVFSFAGFFSIILFIIQLWFEIDRAPMRTLGETRLLYSIFMPLIGLFVYIKWKYKWFIIYTLLMSILFLIINLLTPENFDKTLMPALQSVWFVPHVVVYIFSYALLAASSIVAVYSLFKLHFRSFDRKFLHLADNLVYIGFGFLTLGLLFGALWAKEAWGHYWTWDPKETWAFITWMGFLVYMHLRFYKPQNTAFPLWILAIAFIILLICWFGINYLPTAQNSVHTYTG